MFYKFILLFLTCRFGVILVDGKINITHFKDSKICSCGLDKGGAIVQILTPKFKFISGAYWEPKIGNLIFTDRLGGSVSGYEPNTGIIRTLHIHELNHMEISAIYPVEGKEHEFVILANQTVYLLKVQENKTDETYTLSEIMKAIDDKRIFSKSTTTIKGNIIVGTIPSNYKDSNATGQSQFIRINVVSKKVEVVDDGFDFASGVCFDRHYRNLYLADVKMNKIWCYKLNTTTGAISDKKLIFDMAHHNDIVHGEVTAITTDTEGNLWIALMKSYQIIVYDPIIWKIIRIMPISSSVVNTLSWGGRSYDILFVGTGQLFPVKDPKQEPASGTLLGISGTGHRGCQLHRVRINE